MQRFGYQTCFLLSNQPAHREFRQQQTQGTLRRQQMRQFTFSSNRIGHLTAITMPKRDLPLYFHYLRTLTHGVVRFRASSRRLLATIACVRAPSFT
jgi:hypothetical protein